MVSAPQATRLVEARGALEKPGRLHMSADAVEIAVEDDVGIALCSDEAEALDDVDEVEEAWEPPP